MQNGLDTLASVARVANGASNDGAERNAGSSSANAPNPLAALLPANTDPALLLHLITEFQKGGVEGLAQAQRDIASGKVTAETLARANGSSGAAARAREAAGDEHGGNTRDDRAAPGQTRQANGTAGSEGGSSKAQNQTKQPGGSAIHAQTNEYSLEPHGPGGRRATGSAAGERFQNGSNATSNSREGSVTADTRNSSNPSGGPGPSTIASRKRRRSVSAAAANSAQNAGAGYEPNLDDGGNDDDDDDDDNDAAYAELNDEMNLMDAMGDGDNSEGQDDSQDPDLDSGGRKAKRPRGGKARRLDPAEALRRRKERNKRAAQISRDQRKQAQNDMQGRLRLLEGEHVDLIARFHGLEQEYQRVLAENASLRQERDERARAAATLPVPSTNPSENTITINGISLNLDQYLALSSLRPRNSTTRAVAQQMGIAAEGGDDDDEEEDADFTPSSPVHGEDTPGADPGTGKSGEDEETTPRAATEVEPDDGDGDGDFLTEAPSSPGGEDDDFDDDHFDDEDMDDEELFLPIEDVPIPEGEPERLQAAYHQQASTNEVLLQQLQQAQATENARPAQINVSTNNETANPSESTAMQAALNYAQLTGNPAPHPAPPQSSHRATLGGSAPLPPIVPSQPATTSSSSLDGLANILSHPGIASNPVVVRQLLDAYGVLPGSGEGMGAPDRGYGLGRGAQRESDPGAMARQMLIMSQLQNQNQPQY